MIFDWVLSSQIGKNYAYPGQIATFTSGVNLERLSKSIFIVIS